MRKMIYLLFFVVAAACANGQGLKPIWNATIKVLDESGQPIAGADVKMSWHVTAPDGSETFDKTEGLTDANGMFITSHEANRSIDLGFTARKRGYYSTTKGHEFADFNDSDPEKLSPHVTLVLKKIEDPIPMYARWVDSEPHAFKKTGRPPINFNTSIGYDLTAGDWVAPYGKGTNADMLFTEEFNKQSVMDYYYKLTISFPDADDGIQEYIVPDAEKGCRLRSPQEAPLDGYQSQLIRENYHHPGEPGKSNYDENRIYLFRTTLSDGVHYGKIYGDPEQTPFCYYLNPTPNDRDIEFDPMHNLLGGLQSSEKVTAP